MSKTFGQLGVGDEVYVIKDNDVMTIIEQSARF